MSPQLHTDILSSLKEYLGRNIIYALKEKRFEDAQILMHKRDNFDSETLTTSSLKCISSAVLPDDVRTQFESIVTRTTARLDYLADYGDIEGCEICHIYQEKIRMILDRNISCAASASVSASASSEAYSSTLAPYSYSSRAPRSASPCAQAHLPYDPPRYTPAPTATATPAPTATATATPTPTATATVALQLSEQSYRDGPSVALSSTSTLSSTAQIAIRCTTLSDNNRMDDKIPVEKS